MATSFYQVVNYFQTTLSEDLDSGETKIVLDSETGLPTSYPYLLTIWDGGKHINPNLDDNMEIVEVTEDYVGSGLTCTRGKESTTDGDHVAGDSVAVLLTAGIIQQIQDAVNALE